MNLISWTRLLLLRRRGAVNSPPARLRLLAHTSRMEADAASPRAWLPRTAMVVTLAFLGYDLSACGQGEQPSQGASPLSYPPIGEFRPWPSTERLKLTWLRSGYPSKVDLDTIIHLGAEGYEKRQVQSISRALWQLFPDHESSLPLMSAVERIAVERARTKWNVYNRYTTEIDAALGRARGMTVPTAEMRAIIMQYGKELSDLRREFSKRVTELPAVKALEKSQEMELRAILRFDESD